jgi:RND family efflux transporter MFP subunit
MKNLSLAALLVALAAGCAQEVEKAEVVRPVRTLTVGAPAADQWTLAGEVRARYETRLAFRLPGHMLERKVEVGSRVAAGQVIARIDARDAQLAATQARAQLAQAESAAALAEADLQRFRELRTRNFISDAEIDRRAAQALQAREQVSAARAALTQSTNQVGYAELSAPHAGVITALEAEAGQVLAAGQTVARIARPEQLEVIVSVPEHRLQDFARGTRYEVRLWATPGRTYAGHNSAGTAGRKSHATRASTKAAGAVRLRRRLSSIFQRPSRRMRTTCFPPEVLSAWPRIQGRSCQSPRTHR